MENLDKIFYPMLVSSISGRLDDRDTILDRWDSFDVLAEEEKDIIISNEIAIAIKNISEKLGLDRNKTEDFSRLVRRLFFKEISHNNLPNELMNKLNLDFDNAQLTNNLLKQSVQDIDNSIKNKSLEKVNAVNRRLISISLADALKQYPNVGEQLITSSGIKLRIFPQPVRPSIKNWLEDYQENMGAQKHGMMERGNYLFHSENTKRLISGERKKLGEILRSLDEGVTLKIDPNRQEIVFEAEVATNGQTEYRQAPNSRPQIPNNFQDSNAKIRNKNDGYSQNIPHIEPEIQNSGNIRFSSPHVMPSESSMNHEARIMHQENDRVKQVFQVSNKNIAPIRQEKFPPIQRQPTGNPMAGKPWGSISQNTQRNEPRIMGNVVDLKN